MNGGEIKIRPEFYGPEPEITIYALNTATDCSLLNSQEHNKNSHLDQDCNRANDQAVKPLTRGNGGDRYDGGYDGTAHGGKHADDKGQVGEWRISEALLFH